MARSTPHRDGPSAGRSGRLGGRIGFVVNLLVITTVLAVVTHECWERDRAAREQEAAQQARVAARQEQLGRARLDAVLALCTNQWREVLALYQEPVALAWTREGLDGYFHEGEGGSSLRQVRCNAEGVSRGPRVADPLHRLLPAEAPAESAAAGAGLTTARPELARAFAESELAFELVRHPLTGEVVSRLWTAAPEGAIAAVSPDAAPAFPLLVASPRFRPATPLPALATVPRHDWLSEPQAAFDLLARQMPKGALVSELTLTADEIDVQIAHPTPAGEGRRPSPFGDQEFDEYGVARAQEWYAQDIPGFGCHKGRPLASVREAFDRAHARYGNAPLAQAWYSCSPAFTNKRDGSWHLVTAR
jgi:hypothetical protein